MEQPPSIKIPEPIPVISKIKSKLELFYEKSANFKMWKSKLMIVDIFYLYLFKKYKTKCLLNDPTYKYSLNMTMGLTLLTHYENDTEKKNYIKHLSNIASLLTNCIKRNVETIIIPLTIGINAQVNTINTSLHGNVLIYRKKDNVIEHFEPHGAVLGVMPEKEKLVREQFEQFMSILNKVQKKEHLPMITLQSASDICPYVKGLQYLEQFSPGKTTNGFCGVWSLFFTELALSNPNVSSRDLFDIVYKHVNGPKGGPYLRKIAEGYSYFISEKIEKYYSILLGKPMLFDEISNNGSGEFIDKLGYLMNWEMYKINNNDTELEKYISIKIANLTKLNEKPKLTANDKKIKKILMDELEMYEKIKLFEETDAFSPVSTPKQKSLTPKQKSPTPKQKSPTPKQKSLTPKQKSPTPKQKSLTPKQKSPTPKSITLKNKSSSPEETEINPKTGKTKTQKNNKAIKECPEGKERNPVSGKCVNIKTQKNKKIVEEGSKENDKYMKSSPNQRIDVIIKNVRKEDIETIYRGDK